MMPHVRIDKCARASARQDSRGTMAVDGLSVLWCCGGGGELVSTLRARGRAVRRADPGSRALEGRADRCGGVGRRRLRCAARDRAEDDDRSQPRRRARRARELGVARARRAQAERRRLDAARPRQSQRHVRRWRARPRPSGAVDARRRSRSATSRCGFSPRSSTSRSRRRRWRPAAPPAALVRYNLAAQPLELCVVGSNDPVAGGSLLSRAAGAAEWAERGLAPLEYQLLRALCARAAEEATSPSAVRGCVPTKQLARDLPFQSKYANEENVRQVVRRLRTASTSSASPPCSRSPRARLLPRVSGQRRRLRSPLTSLPAPVPISIRV